MSFGMLVEVLVEVLVWKNAANYLLFIFNKLDKISIPPLAPLFLDVYSRLCDLETKALGSIFSGDDAAQRNMISMTYSD